MASAPLTANRYAYALGNPLRYTDPSGHFVNEFLRHPGLWSSVFVQSLPFAGDFYSGLTGLWGFDPIAGITLSPADRALAIGSAFMVGGGLHLVGHVATGPGDEIAEAAGRSVSRTGSRSVDGTGELGGLGRGRRAGGVGDLQPTPASASLRRSDALSGVEQASPDLLRSVGSRRTVNYARPGSDELRYLDLMGAEANVGGPSVSHILLRENPSKAAVLEEFLHGTQHRLGLVERLGVQGAEAHVEDFMIRHSGVLGLIDEDVERLRRLMELGL